MHKIIHSKFQLDLSNYSITHVEENHWFNDQFFSKYSFPFNMYMTEDLIKIFGELLDDNNMLSTTYFEVQYVFQNKIESAILEIENQDGLVLKPTIRYGLDELPNWNKKLKELPLEEVAITDIFAHAKSIIPQTWPAVNYNFPQIHTDKFDSTEDTWATFQKIINNYNGTDFLTNTFTAGNFANRNIIQPCPSFLHILTVLFQDAGFTLKGDVTTDDVFKKMLMYTPLDYFDRIGDVEKELLLLSNEASTTDGNSLRHYYKSIELLKNSRYKITGTGMFRNWYVDSDTFANLKITYRGVDVFYRYIGTTQRGYFTFSIDITIDTFNDDDPHLLEFSAATLLMLGSTPIYGTLEEGNFTGVKIQKIIEGLETPPDEIHIKNELNLKNVVPDITGGTFITILKNWFNIDLDIVGKDIYMNFIENEINYNNAENLTNFEVLKPSKKSNNNISFLLKFEDTDNEDYTFDVVYHDKNIVEFSDKKVLDSTNQILINALPLPQKNILGIETAYEIEQNGGSKIYAVLYNGLQNGLNLTEDSSPIKIPAIHAKHYNNWFTFRINATAYNWTFKMFAEKLANIKKKVFAYGRYHVVKSIEKTQISEDLFEVDIETETLP